MSKKRLSRNASIFEIFLAKSRCYNGRVPGFAASLIARLDGEKKSNQAKNETLALLRDMLCLSQSTDNHVVARWYKKSRIDNSSPTATPQQFATIVALNQMARAQGTFHHATKDIQSVQTKPSWNDDERQNFIRQYADQHLTRMAIVVDAATNAWKNDPKISPSANSLMWAQTLIAQFAHAGATEDDARYHALRNDACLYLSDMIVDKVRKEWGLPAAIHQEDMSPQI